MVCAVEQHRARVPLRRRNKDLKEKRVPGAWLLSTVQRSLPIRTPPSLTSGIGRGQVQPALAATIES